MPGRQYVTISKQQGIVGGVLIGRESVPTFKETTLTNAQILALRATPIAIAPAPGAGIFREFTKIVLMLKAAGGAYTESTANLIVRQNNGSGVILSEVIEMTGFIDQAAVKLTTGRSKIDPIGALQNKSLVLHNNGAAEFGGGNAANTLFVRCYYIDHSLAGIGTAA